MNLASEIMSGINVVDALINLIQKAKHPHFENEVVQNVAAQAKGYRDYLAQQHQKAVEAEKKEPETSEAQ